MYLLLMALAVILSTPIVIMLDVDEFAGKFFSAMSGTKV